jgi:hypothetical protein
MYTHNAYIMMAAFRALLPVNMSIASTSVVIGTMQRSRYVDTISTATLDLRKNFAIAYYKTVHTRVSISLR